MKGKIAFVLGAAAGYVLGTRAGRERYEQIKRGAKSLWQTTPVQKGVNAVKGAAEEKLGELKDSAVQAGKNAFAAFAQTPAPAERATRTSAASTPADVSVEASTDAPTTDGAK